MRPALLAGIALATAAGAATTYSTDPETRLAKLLAGRVAGPPVACITLFRDHRVTTIDHVAEVYDVGATRYVNRFDAAGCQALTGDTIGISRTPTDRLCEGDILELRSNPPPNVPVGSCVYGKFTPYKKIG